jgi:hypothetical protein
MVELPAIEQGAGCGSDRDRMKYDSGVLHHEGGVSMHKTVTISFRTRKELLEWLDRVSAESRCSRSSLIETILRNFLAESGGKQVLFDDFPEIKDEMKDVPSIEGELPSGGGPFVEVGGVRIGLPKNLRCQIFFDRNRSVFQLDFSPQEGSSIESSPEQDTRIVVLNAGREASLA